MEDNDRGDIESDMASEHNINSKETDEEVENFVQEIDENLAYGWLYIILLMKTNNLTNDVTSTIFSSSTEI